MTELVCKPKTWFSYYLVINLLIPAFLLIKMKRKSILTLIVKAPVTLFLSSWALLPSPPLHLHSPRTNFRFQALPAQTIPQTISHFTSSHTHCVTTLAHKPNEAIYSLKSNPLETGSQSSPRSGLTCHWPRSLLTPFYPALLQSLKGTPVLSPAWPLPSTLWSFILLAPLLLPYANLISKNATHP